MPEFFDHLWEQAHKPQDHRQRAQYLQQLKTYIPESPPVRRIGKSMSSRPLMGMSLQQHPKLLSFQGFTSQLFLYDLNQAEASWFRLAKAQEPLRPFWRQDIVHDELQVLEARAMGADAYCLDMGELDLAAIQYLCEVGWDYDFPAILCCKNEGELAHALQIQDVSTYWLKGILVAPQLLELALLRGKNVIFDLQNSEEAAAFEGCKDTQVILIQAEIDR